MISLQRSMHSSQMYTPGPAMSFLTCFWDFPQKEHFSRSPPSPIRATYVLLELIVRHCRRLIRGWIASLPSHRLPDRVTEAACSTLPAKGQFSDPPKRACQGSASLTRTGRPLTAPSNRLAAHPRADQVSPPSAAGAGSLQALLTAGQDDVDQAVLL